MFFCDDCECVSNVSECHSDVTIRLATPRFLVFHDVVYFICFCECVFLNIFFGGVVRKMYGDLC